MSIITISRGSHSGGQAVAGHLAAQLGCPLLSREQLLQQAARDYGILEKDLADSLILPPQAWQQVLGKRLAYVKCVTAVLLDHARQGNLIYHGNVGHLLLTGIPRVLRVRVIADMEQRISAAMTQTGMDREKTIAYIHRMDRERSKWAKALYGVDWEDPSQYHLILNLERLSVANAGATIAHMSELEDFKPDDASRKALENASLACRVWAAMAKNPATRSATLEVNADDGEVVVSGNVGSAKTIELIADTARQVDGVKVLRCEVGMGTDWYW